MNDIFKTIGLCFKTGKMKFGTENVLNQIRSNNKPFSVYISNDISDNSKKKILNSCKYYKIKLFRLPVSGYELAHSIGKNSDVTTVSINDENICILLNNSFNASENNLNISLEDDNKWLQILKLKYQH